MTQPENMTDEDLCAEIQRMARDPVIQRVVRFLALTAEADRREDEVRQRRAQSEAERMAFEDGDRMS